MKTPSTPNGAGRMAGVSRTKDRAAQQAHGGKERAARAGRGAGQAAGGAARQAGSAARRAGEGVQHGAGQVAGTAAALPGQVVKLTKLLTVGRLLRAAPAVAVAGVAILVGRRVARRR
ncbi:hypothetical protein ACFY4C_12210 [Actinomadura viridis]|uniref:hypothetical protein n=1 Tax=Actinomadura viridis TaxID=58110 RepID=UPI0036767139